MVTMKDIAKKAGVSATTVSAALRGTEGVSSEVAARIRTIAERMNYRVNASAQALRSGHTNTITLFTASMATQYYHSLATSLSYEATTQGFETRIQQSRFITHDEADIIRNASASQSDGLIFISTSLTPRQVLDCVGGKPVVMFENYMDDQLIDSVNTPSRRGAQTAIKHLVDQGCTRIGIIGKDTLPYNAYRPSPLAGRSRNARILAAQQAITDLGLPHAQTSCEDVDWSAEGGIEAAYRMADAGLPYDGVFCANDITALGVLRGLADRGVRVPQDVAVIGFDGIDTSTYSVPRLSTIALDYQGMARSAVMLLLQQINHPDTPSLPQTVTAGFTLEVRESSLRR
ncbi:LacI family DNA-binding transcriptional regulator [Bifidobacterium oedipodis]|uniref:LacI family transcriptional regulator n=1 Tax=Bifidobacterium oedipodis TaxID=2675322 RepID=A0A7Y0HSZ5_9BIFI|nr:LacI family DNA-binding transcriptional regulator [Bifidobacterium sp. DSM 109957]NMM94113.1 LacI family transcriptional regulator [Bifidobacterium sp. DSM 109957]